MQSNTERENYAFVVKELSSGDGWQVMLEPRHENLPVFEDGFLCLELGSGATREDAVELARALSRHVENVSHTRILVRAGNE